MSEQRTAIKVMVLGHNSAGAADKYVVSVLSTEYEREHGVHYEQAKSLAKEAGYEPCMCIDEDDEVWGQLQPKPVYQELLEKLIVDFQHVYLPGFDCNGGDLVEDLAEQFQQILTVDMPAAEAPAELCFVFKDGSYLNGDEEQNPSEIPRCALYNAEVERLAESGAIVVKVNPAELIDGDLTVPTSAELEEAAAGAKRRAEEYGFAIDESNAADVMSEELAQFGHHIGTGFAPLLQAAYFHHKNTQADAERSIGREVE
jgi:hypothetical protein